MRHLILPARAASLCLILAASCFAAARATVPAPDGSISSAVRDAFASGLLDVPDRSGLQTNASQQDWYLPIILVSYQDSTLRHTAAQFQAQIFDTTHASPTGSLVDYYQSVGGGQIHVRGEVVATVTIPHEMDYYAFNSYGLDALVTPNNDWGLVYDAVQQADSLHVDWNRFDRNGDGTVDMLWVVHAGLGGEGSTTRRNPWSITSMMSSNWSNGGALETRVLVPGTTTRHVRIDRFSILPELSMFKPGQISEIGVYCHEFGHALGLPDLYDTSQLGGAGNSGPGQWSLMSTGAWGGDGHSPELPSLPGGWCSVFLGVTPMIQPKQDTLVTLTPMTRAGSVYSLTFQGESQLEHVIVEARYREGYDIHLPNDGVLLTQVDEGLLGLRLAGNRVNSGSPPALRVLEADGRFDMVTGYDRGDASDPLPGSHDITRLDDFTTPSLRMTSGLVSNTSIDGVTRLGPLTQLALHVRSPGWQAVEDATEPGYAPVSSSNRGHHLVVTPQGTEYEVYSDSRSGTPQVLLRSRPMSGAWSASTPVSASPAGAYDPCISLLPGNDLAVAWADLRDGTSQVYYRSRVGGTWSTEARLSQGIAAAPAIATDSRGRVFTSWIDLSGTPPRLEFLAFTWANPFGRAVVVTDTLGNPSAPSLAATRDGHAWLLWPDRGTGSHFAIRFARFSPDSGLLAPLPLTYPTIAGQPAVDVATDSGSVVHIVWQQTNSGLNEIHYQRRFPAGKVQPIDTTLTAASQTIQNPAVAADLEGGVHVAFERIIPPAQQVRYMLWRPDRGWDSGPTDVTDPATSNSGLLGMAAITYGNVNLALTDHDLGGYHARYRRRRLDGNFALDVPASPAARSAGFRIGPSPAIAGAPLELRGAALGSGHAVDLFDATGRRVASTLSQAERAQFSAATTRALLPGLYFVRVRGGESARLVVLR